ncbi:hypothetical protein [Frondihabitans peucedani]|uniref:Uncharacterized protein n=1 Tax=Frondihabitans peucedani TaxID=598626 RepID=A0ABP8E3M6_9MICO
MNSSTKPLEILRAAFGLAELLFPDQVAEHILGHPADPRERVFIRILGGRHLTQAAILLILSRRTAHRLGGVVDLIHAGTMVAVAVTDPRRKVAGTVNATVAVVFAAGELR